MSRKNMLSIKPCGLEFLLTRNGATNVWEQPLAGGPPYPVTTFTSGHIFDFAWSRDGKQLLLAKGDETSDDLLTAFSFFLASRNLLLEDRAIHARAKVTPGASS